MTKEEFIGKMQMVYIGDKNALNECTQEYLRLREVISKAIEYINNHDLTCNENWLVQYEKELLDILKEVINNE